MKPANGGCGFSMNLAGEGDTLSSLNSWFRIGFSLIYILGSDILKFSDEGWHVCDMLGLSFGLHDKGCSALDLSKFV